jgi:DNA primase
VLDFAQKFYQNYLFENDIGQAIGKEYFKERGFNEATIKTFDLGYSPDGWDVFTKHALRNGFSLDILERAGLTITKEGKDPIDRFRGRVIFPIHNVAGKPIAFGARILKKDPNAPKYLNSPETAIYHKSSIVYGIFHAKTAIRNEDNCFLVEGYTDVVSMYQAGIQNVVASSGTSLTKEQIQLIRRFTNNITVLYDGDAAGIKASLRGIDIILEEGLNVKSVVFPDGDDPDSFVQKVGSQAFTEYIKQTAQNFITFKTGIFLKDLGNDPIKRAELISDLVQTITKIPDAIKRSVFFKEVATQMGIEEQILISESNKISLKSIQEKEKERQREKRVSPVNELNISVEEQPEISPFAEVDFSQKKGVEIQRSGLSYHEEECVRLLVCYGNHVIERNYEEKIDITLADYIFQEIKDLAFDTPTYNKILSVYREKYLQRNLPETTFFTSHQDEEIQRQAINWLSTPHQVSENWAKKEIYVPLESEKLDEMAYTNILRLKKARFEQEMMKLTNDLGEMTDFDEQLLVMQKMKQIKEVIKKIADSLGTVVQG